MLDIHHTCTHCDTFYCKQTTCLSHVIVTIDWGSESEIQAVFNIFQVPWIWTIWHKLNITECEYQYGHNNYSICTFYVYVSTVVTADVAYCPTLAAWYWRANFKPKIWMHIKHWVIVSKGFRLKKNKDILCFDAAASDVNICMWCLVSLMDIFKDFFPQFLEQLCKKCTICQTKFHLRIEC